MTDEQHEEIRALLADLGSRDASVPADVAARLDHTLARLVADRRVAGTRDPGEADSAGAGNDERVVPLPEQPRGRRPWGPRLLAAATVAAVVGGLGIAIQQTAQQGSSTMSASSGGSAVDRQPAESGSGQGPAAAALPRLSTRHFHRDAGALLAQRPPALRHPGARVNAQKRAAADGRTGGSTGGSTGATPGCARPAHRHDARIVDALVDGRPASVLVRALGAGATRVTAYSCTGERLAATTVRR